MYTAAFLAIAAAISAAASPVPIDSPIQTPRASPCPTPAAKAPASCHVNTPTEYLAQFEQGPNTCTADQYTNNGTMSPTALFARLEFNINRSNPLPIVNAEDSIFQHGPARPFVFASGDGGCVNDWLQAGAGNTPAQYKNVLDIGYTAQDRCESVRLAQNATLLVWEAQPSDAVLATWDNVVPYMANLYGVAHPVVTAETMKSTNYSTFAQNPQYAVEQKIVGRNFCASAYSGKYMRNAMTKDPSGLKFRAALEQCYSFFNVFQGTGYALNPVTGNAFKCKEFLYPNKYFKDFPQDGIVALDLQIGANFQSNEVDPVCTH